MPHTVENALSIFVDESGDFGSYQKHSPFYILSFVFHEQINGISEPLDNFNEMLNKLLFDTSLNETGADLQIHAGPIIRNEMPFGQLSLAKRKSLLFQLTNLTRKLPIHHATFVVDRVRNPTPDEALRTLRNLVGGFILKHSEYFTEFDIIKVYYDKGQEQITAIIRDYILEGFESTFKLAGQEDFRLAQIADLICTLELVRVKGETNRYSHTEKRIFGEYRNFRRQWIRKIEDQRFQ